MNERQVHKFVQRYLEATDCRILEKSPAHFIVKLSPSADRDLTNRPFYWSFVDRTGAPAETMSMLLVTDRNKYESASAQTAERERAGKAAQEPADAGTGGKSGAGTPGRPAVAAAGGPDTAGSGGSGGASAPAGTGTDAAQAGESGQGGRPGMESAAAAALGRSLGFVHGSLNAGGRLPREELHFGSRKLEQLFESARRGGSYVCLFQEPEKRSAHPLDSTAYTAWLGVNFKVEFACDMKREEFHSFGVSLATGLCVEQFYDRLAALRMTPKLPPNIHTAKNALSLGKAAAVAEQTLERKLRTYDYAWAEAAASRLEDELATLRHYYEPLIAESEEDKRAAAQEQFDRRQEEIRWQYEPRVTVSGINCGIFYLEGIG